MIAHFTMPKRLGDGMKWLIVDVLLSQVPSLAQIRAVDLDDKARNVIENKGARPHGCLLPSATSRRTRIRAHKPPAEKLVWPWGVTTAMVPK